MHCGSAWRYRQEWPARPRRCHSGWWPPPRQARRHQSRPGAWRRPGRPPAPLLGWAVLDGGTLVPADLLRDETGGLRSGGIVELGVPGRWQPGRPPGSVGLPELCWLRAALEHGEYPTPPVLTAVLVNAARATATRTIRDEPLERLPDAPGRADPDAAGPDPDRAGQRGARRGRRPGRRCVRDYHRGARHGGPRSAASAVLVPTRRVFTVDYATGEVTFGDGVHGARVPDGFRNVRAARYRVGGGAAGAVAAGAVSAPLTSVGFVTAVTNPYPASGGTDTEPDSDAVLRGAEELRTGDRAVAPADYGVLARNAPGALVARAQGVAGPAPRLPGRADPRRSRRALRRPGPRYRPAPGTDRG